MRSGYRFGVSVFVTALVLVGTGLGQTPPTTAPAAPDEQKPAGQPRIKLDESEFDFGKVWEGKTVRREFVIANVGNAPLEIESVRGNCGCTVPTRPKSPLAPGEQSSFFITYDTRRIGPAGKKVTIKSNDPENGEVVIPVDGRVSPLFEFKPQRRLMISGIEPEDVGRTSVRLKNLFPEPIRLKLKEESHKRFAVQLRELEAGQQYELVVETVPPLLKGINREPLVLLTGLDWYPEIELPMAANAQPRVLVVPFKIAVPTGQTEPLVRQIRMQYRVDKPVKITRVSVNLESVVCKLLPAEPPKAGATVANYVIEVTVPPGVEIPPGGAYVEILTDDPSPQYARFTVPVESFESRSRR
jgi:hypothetical protein